MNDVLSTVLTLDFHEECDKMSGSPFVFSVI